MTFRYKFVYVCHSEMLFKCPQRIRKELNLLQKLYQLYNAVLETVNGYYDIAWVDIDIDKINNDLIDFQNK